jgi:DNA-binding response OmpR family regulator
MPDPASASAWRGRRILVVEDDYMLAEDLRRDLEKQGAEVVGPVPTVADALKLLTGEDVLDGAILDVNLRGERVYPVVDVLRERGVPLVFTTGYEQWALPEAYADVPRCEKPVDMRQLAGALFG